MSIGRGKAPSDTTIKMLCAKSAGRCQFDGCNEFLFEDPVTLKRGNFSNVAHIIASSPNGSRGDEELSHGLSDEMDNLILLCPKHHKLVDDDPDTFSADYLREMKNKQETAVEELCQQIGRPASEIITLASPIKGKVDVSVNYRQAIDAISNEKKPYSTKGIPLNIRSVHDYNSVEYWNDVDKQLTAAFDRFICNSALEIDPDLHFSVFSLAPIPLIIKLGFLMGDKIPSDIYQKTREPDTWRWLSDELHNDFTVEKIERRSGNKYAVVVSITADIAEKRVTEVYDADTIFYIKAHHFGVNAITSKADLAKFWEIYQKLCDDIVNSGLDIKEIALFPAIPVSVAYEIGRRYMPGVYPRISVYDENDGFIRTLIIGESNDR